MSGRKQPRRRGVRRREERGRGWRIALAFSVVTLVISALIFLAITAGTGDIESSIGPATPDPAGSPDPAATAPPSKPTGASPTRPPSPTPTLGVVLPCGDILVPIGKERSLPADCAPGDLVALPERMSRMVDLPIVLRAEAAAAMVEMLDAARAEGLVIVVRSAYRSYGDQERTYAANVAAYGQEYADRSSARAGHSEHQLGTTGDLTSAPNGYELEGFEATSEGRWVAANAARFGFVISYPAGKEDITGYVYEPWHLRYVGRAVAQEIVASGLTPVEYLERR